MGTVVTPDSALSVGVSSCQPEKISDKCALSACLGGVGEGVCRPPERRGGGVWRGYWHRSPWHTESYDFFCTAGRGSSPLNFGIPPELGTDQNLLEHMTMAKRNSSPTTITLTLTKVSTGATSKGAPYLYTSRLPPNVKGCCRAQGTEDASEVAFFGAKPMMVAVDSEAYKEFLAQRRRSGR